MCPAVGKDFFEEDPEPEEDAAASAAAAAAAAAQAEKRRLRKEAAAASAAAEALSALANAGVAPVAAPEGVSAMAPASNEQQKPQSKQANVRGKSGQRKKMKEKYRDQGNGTNRCALSQLLLFSQLPNPTLPHHNFS